VNQEHVLECLAMFCDFSTNRPKHQTDLHQKLTSFYCTPNGYGLTFKKKMFQNGMKENTAIMKQGKRPRKSSLVFYFGKK